jgi:hypothetical protein
MNQVSIPRSTFGRNAKIDQNSLVKESLLKQDDGSNLKTFPILADKNLLYDVPLIHIDCSFGIVCEQRQKIASLRKILHRERKKLPAEVTVVFVVRRPGCGACRDHGRQLTSLLINMSHVNAIGIIKEIDVDNKALLEFYEEYFKYPIYKDENWFIFKKIFGDRKIPILKLLCTFYKMTKRYKERKIVNRPFGGDIFTQGGVLIFDKEGTLRHVFYENYTEDFDLEEMKSAIEDAKRSQNENRSTIPFIKGPLHQSPNMIEI